MKKQFQKVLREINFNVDMVFLFDSILSSVMVFLIALLILSIFNRPNFFAIIPAGMYFVIEYYIRFSENKARLVESKYPELNEMLRTAEDNVELENQIVEELQTDVISRLRHVSLSSFLNTKRFSYKILVCIILSFVIISFSVFGINISLLTPLMENVPFFGGNWNKSLGLVNITGVKLNISDEIYGDDSVAKLGDSLIDIKIMPSTFEVSVKEEGNVETSEFYEAFPSEVFVEKANTYEENVPKEQQKLVKNYFKKISEG